VTLLKPIKFLAVTFGLFLLSTSWSTPLRAQPNTAPKYVDLRGAFTQWGLPIKAQGQRDTCAVFTLTGALEYALAKSTDEKGVRLSEEYLNWAANEVAGECDNKRVLDAALIAAAQAVEHYEITRYGSMIAWSEELGRDAIGKLLTTNLNEEKAADKKLTTIGEKKVNLKAAG